MKRHRIRGPWTAESLALHTQAVLQGAFILAKARGGAAIAAASIDHLRRYIELLFKPVTRKPRKRHEHKQYLSRRVSRQQDQPAARGLGRPCRKPSATPSRKQGGPPGAAWMQKHQAIVHQRRRRAPGKNQEGFISAASKTSPIRWRHFVIVQAESHEAAAKLFEESSAFRDFPGDAVEIMPVKAIPGA